MIESSPFRAFINKIGINDKSAVPTHELGSLIVVDEVSATAFWTHGLFGLKTLLLFFLFASFDHGTYFFPFKSVRIANSFDFYHIISPYKLE